MAFLKFSLIILIFMSTMTTFIQAAYPRKMVVVVPVANLVDTPGFDHEKRRGLSFSKNVSHLQTQLLFNEQVLALEEMILDDKKWVRVLAQEQKKVSFDDENVLEGYPGWMRAQDLSEVVEDGDRRQNYIISNLYESMSINESIIALPFGTKLAIKNEVIPSFCQAKLFSGQEGVIVNRQFGPLNQNSLTQIYDLSDINHDTNLQFLLRKKIVDNARLFLGMPYVWGGSSPYRVEADFLTGVDCSALIYLSYRVCGLEIPRNAHDQFLTIYSIEPAQMQPGDLVFFGVERERGDEKIVRVNHVLMYTGEGTLIEAWGDGQVDAGLCEHKDLLCVREISVEEQLGKPLSELVNEEFLDAKNVFVYFRTVFSPTE